MRMGVEPVGSVSGGDNRIPAHMRWQSLLVALDR